MSLLKPTVGECLDRLSIIALKMMAGNTAEHLVAERNALAVIVYQAGKPLMRRAGNEDAYYPLWFLVGRAGNHLAAVNAFIWHKEDEIRRRGAAVPIAPLSAERCSVERLAIAALAIEIRGLADRRHELIAEIDRVYGDARAGKEKSWMAPPPAPSAMQSAHLPGCECRGCL